MRPPLRGMGSIFSLEKKCLMYPAPWHLHGGGRLFLSSDTLAPSAPGRGDSGGHRMRPPLSSLKDLAYPRGRPLPSLGMGSIYPRDHLPPSTPMPPGRGDSGGHRMRPPLSSLKDLTYPRGRPLPSMGMGSIFSLEKKCLMYPAPWHLHGGATLLKLRYPSPQCPWTGGRRCLISGRMGSEGGSNPRRDWGRKIVKGRIINPTDIFLVQKAPIWPAKGPVQAADICHNGRPPGFPTALPPQHRLGRA